MTMTNGSLPLWKCGLKFGDYKRVLVDALSLPLWKCGLKSKGRWYNQWWHVSLPLWKCGLKSDTEKPLQKPESHFPCGSADWNCTYMTKCTEIKVTSLVEVRIEIELENDSGYLTKRHFPCGSADWNNYRYRCSRNNSSHFPCGRADWNKTGQSYGEPVQVTSLVEVRIEISNRPHAPQAILVTSLAEVRIEIAKDMPRSMPGQLISLAEVWIEITELKI